jgi:hypothetical protein
MSLELISAIYETATLAIELRRRMTGEGIEPPLFLYVRQAPYLLGDPAENARDQVRTGDADLEDRGDSSFTTLARSPRRESNPSPQIYKI